MFTMIEAPHTGNMLRQFVKKNRLFQSGWARQQGVLPTTIATYLKNPTLRVDTLFTICQVLEYNFFKEIANALPVHFPPKTKTENDQLVEELKQQLHDQQIKIEVLEKALALVGSR
jgi:hypothetical protein